MVEKYALLSVYHKDGIVEFARELVDLGYKILSTGGTAGKLKESNIDVIQVSDHTGSPEILNGRVKTLHPVIHGGILAKRELQDHMDCLKEAGIPGIDIVAVNLYPFKSTAAKNLPEADTVEQIDIGGPSMIRSSAKNYRDVIVICDPDDYRLVVEKLKSDEGIDLEMRRKLAEKAFCLTANYDAAISAWFGKLNGFEFPEMVTVPLVNGMKLRYGENPHQTGAFYALDSHKPCGIAATEILNGKELSYNNYLDLSAAWELVCDLKSPAVTVIKHLTPCGCAQADTLERAFVKAYNGDPLSAFGGIVACSIQVDAATAEEMAEGQKFFEVIIAPSFSPEALEILKTKPKWGKNVRLIKAGEPVIHDKLVYRSVPGGVLIQSRDKTVFENGSLKFVSGEVDPVLEEEFYFGMAVCKHVKSNAIVLTNDKTIVGVGAGQMSRIDALKLAVRKAGDKAEGSILSSDAFFPFPDVITEAGEAGIKAIVQPGGSRRDQLCIEEATKRKITMAFSGLRHFKH